MKTVPISFVLKLIALQASGDERHFRDEALKLAEELDKTDPELSLHILSQYGLTPTFSTMELEQHFDIRNGDFVKFTGFPNIPEDKNFQVIIVDGQMKIVGLKR